jgi:hypothetical protein
MPFDVEMPDGTVIQDVPDGTTKEQVLAKYNAMKGTAAQVPDVRTEGFASNEGGAAFGVPRQMGGRRAVVQSVTPLEAVAGDVLKGAVLNPAMAVAQVVGGQKARDYTSGIERQQQAARKEAGLEGVALGEIAGAVFSPINKIIPVGAAGTVAGRGAIAVSYTHLRAHETLS